MKRYGDRTLTLAVLALSVTNGIDAMGASSATPLPSPSASVAAAAVPAAAEKSSTSTTTAPSPSPTILSSASTPAFAEIDELFKKRIEEASARKALLLSREMLLKTPSGGAAWRTAMGCYVVGFKFTQGDSKQDAREALYEEGIKAAKKGVEVDPNCGPCHFWIGVNTALLGESVGPFKMLGSLAEIRTHAEKAIALEPAYAAGGAYRLLGQLEQALPGILGGSDRRAQEYFEKAVAVSAGDPMNYVYLIKILEKRDRSEEALALAKKAAELPPPPADQYESISSAVEIREYLKSKTVK